MEKIKNFSEFSILERELPDSQGKIAVILGAPGSGKGTLSKELADKLYLSANSLERYFIQRISRQI